MIKEKIVGAKLHSSKPVAHGVGRRKAAVARVWLSHGAGRIVVNGKPSQEYFDTVVERQLIEIPLVVCTSLNKFNIYVNVHGGGKTGQADAVKLGIARALLELSSDLKPVLKKDKLLTTDDRVKERKKYGREAARRRFQFVKR